MSLVDHLAELRRRIIICVLSVAIGTALSFYFAPQIIEILKQPYGEAPLLLLAPGEGFFIYLKLSLVAGIILAMPILLWQVWAFVGPGLTRDERRAARPWVPTALLFFGLGVGVAYAVLPFALAFLQQFGTGAFVNQWTADNYFGFVGTMFLAFGLTMEFPIVLVLLSKAGIVTAARLRAARRLVVLGIAIFAALATPGGDFVSPLVLGGVMYLLYELTIVLVRAAGR